MNINLIYIPVIPTKEKPLHPTIQQNLPLLRSGGQRRTVNQPPKAGIARCIAHVDEQRIEAFAGCEGADLLVQVAYGSAAHGGEVQERRHGQRLVGERRGGQGSFVAGVLEGADFGGDAGVLDCVEYGYAEATRNVCAKADLSINFSTGHLN